MDLRLYLIYIISMALICTFNLVIYLKYITFFICSLFIIYLGVLFFIKKKNIYDIIILIKRLLRITGTVSILINSSIDMTALYSYITVQVMPGLPDLTGDSVDGGDSGSGNDDKEKDKSDKEKSVKKEDSVDKLETTSNQLYYLKMAAVAAGIIGGIILIIWLSNNVGGGGINNSSVAGPGHGPGPGGGSRSGPFPLNSEVENSWLNLSYIMSCVKKASVSKFIQNLDVDERNFAMKIYSDWLKHPSDTHLRILDIVKQLVNEGRMSEDALSTLTGSGYAPSFFQIFRLIVTTEFIREYTADPVIITTAPNVESPVETVEIEEVINSNQVSITIPATVSAPSVESPVETGEEQILTFINIINRIYEQEQLLILDEDIVLLNDIILSNNTISNLLNYINNDNINSEVLYLTKNFNFDLNNPEHLHRLKTIFNMLSNEEKNIQFVQQIMEMETVEANKAQDDKAHHPTLADIHPKNTWISKKCTDIGFFVWNANNAIESGEVDSRDIPLIKEVETHFMAAMLASRSNDEEEMNINLEKLANIWVSVPSDLKAQFGYKF